MTIITDPAAAQHVAKLHAEHAALGPAIEAVQQHRSELLARGSALAQRMALEQSQRPQATEGNAVEMAERLIADPSATIEHDSEATERAIAVQVRAETKWRASIKAVETAQAAVRSALSNADQQLADLREEERNSYVLLARAAYAALLREFRDRFVAFRDKLITPLLALEQARIGIRDGGVAQINVGCGGLDADFNVSISLFVTEEENPKRPGMMKENLFYGRNAVNDAHLTDLNDVLALFAEASPAGRSARQRGRADA